MVLKLLAVTGISCVVVLPVPGYIDVDNIDGSPAASDTASTTASPYTFSGQTDGGSMFNGGGSNLSPAGVRNDSQGL